MGIRERKIEKYLHDEVVKLGGTTRKWVSPGHSGVPDRLIFLKGNIFLVEVKTLSGELSPSQVQEIARLTKHDIHVEVVYGPKDVELLINKLKRKFL